MRRRALFAIALAAMVAASEAEAACCVAYDYSHAERVVRDGVIQAITQRIDQLERSIWEALRLHSGQRLEEAQRTIRAMENLAQVQDAREIERRLSDVRVHAARTASPSPAACNIITGTAASGLGGLAPAVAATRAERVHDVMEFLTGGSPRTRTAESAIAGLAQRVVEICETDGTEDMVRAGICRRAARTGAISPALNAMSLLGAAAHGPEEMRAAALFTTAVLGRPVGPLPAGAAQAPNAVELVAGFQTSAARQSVAATALADAAARRRPVQEDALRRWAEGTASQTIGYRPDGTNFPAGVSDLAAMELRSRQWFFNPNWVAQVDTNPDAAAKATAQIAAWLSVLGYEQFRQLEMLNITLATILALLEERSRGG